MIQKYLGNVKDEYYKDVVQNCLNSYRNLGCNMSIKVHFLFSHIENFPENLGDVSDEQVERFHQDIKIMEERYQGRWGKTMMVNFCWCLQRETVNVQYKRKVNKRKMLF